jgi:hypothetical protein
LSILPSPTSIQKPERGRSRNRSATRDVIVSSKGIVDRTDDTNIMDVENQENIGSSQRNQQQTTSNQSDVLRTNHNDNQPERNGDEINEASHSLPSTSNNSIWTFFTHVKDDSYQCRLCSKVRNFSC